MNVIIYLRHKDNFLLRQQSLFFCLEIMHIFYACQKRNKKISTLSNGLDILFRIKSFKHDRPKNQT